MEDMGNDAGARSGDLRPSADRHARLDAARATPDRPVRDEARSVHVLPRHHRLRVLCKRNVVPLPALEDALASARRHAELRRSSRRASATTATIVRAGTASRAASSRPTPFSEHWVPLITSSPAFRADGLLIITFDEALSIDATACCNEPPGPNTLEAGYQRPRRRTHRRGAALAVHQAGHRVERAVQSLLAAAQHRGHLRPRPPRLRRRNEASRPFGRDVFTRVP